MMMRTITAALAFLWLGAMAPVIAAPPLEIYGSLPGFEMAAMSPSGTRVAIVGVVAEKRRLLVVENGESVLAMDAGDEKVRSLIWADENHVLLRISKTIALGGGFTTDRAELSAVLVIPLNGEAPWSVFDKKESVTGGVFGQYGIVNIGGQAHAYFGGVTLDRTYSGNYRLSTASPDLYQVNLASQESRIVARRIEGQGLYRDWIVGPEGAVVASLDFFSNQGDWTIRNAERRIIASGRAPLGGIDLEGLSPTGDSAIYFLRDPDTHAGSYMQQPLAGGPSTEFLKSEQVNDLLIDRRSRRVIGYVRGGDVPEDHYIDSRQERAMAATRKAFPGVSVRIVDHNDAFDKLLVQTSGTGDPQTLWTVDIKSGNADALALAYPMATAQVGPVSMVEYVAADGLRMAGVLTLPPGREPRNLPLVMLPHGGPAARDYPVFDWWAQAFASRGYAVFQPNFRGSTGLGASFRLAGRNEWGRKMQSDLTDGLNALAVRGTINPKRACIVGGSYGGYAALAGVMLQSGLYRCAVAVAGIGDVAKLATDARIESGGNPTVRRWTEVEIGAGRDLKMISPENFADRADAPILLIHGKDDTVVPFRQSSNMFDALKRAGKPVELVTLAGEDHWLSRSETRLTMLKAAVAFVEQHNPADK